MRVQARKKQRPGDEQRRERDEPANHRGNQRGLLVEAKDRSEEHVCRRGAVAGALACREQREKEHPEAKNLREDRSDHDVVGLTPLAKASEEHPHPNRRDEQSESQVDACRERRERPGESDVGQRVPGEHLAAQDEEIADEASGDRDETAREEGESHEGLREHQRPGQVVRSAECPPRGKGMVVDLDHAPRAPVVR